MRISDKKQPGSSFNLIQTVIPLFHHLTNSTNVYTRCALTNENINNEAVMRVEIAAEPPLKKGQSVLARI